MGEKNIDILALEYYLRRKVSHCNKTINGLCQEKGVKQRVVYNELLSKFCKGRNAKSDVLDEIYYMIERNNSADLKPYTYFDLDTLYAYYIYLRNIISYARYHNYDMSKAISMAIGDMLSPETSLEDCGYYDMNNPVTLRIDKSTGKVAPLKRLSTEKFSKTYEGLACRDMLSDYLSLKKDIPRKQPIENKSTEKKETHSAPEIKQFVERKRDKESHKQEGPRPEKKLIIVYKGINFEVLSKNYEHQHRDNFTPLFRIEGVSVDGKYRLVANVDLDNKVYEGLVMNHKGEKLCDNSPAELITVEITAEEIEERRKKKGITTKPKVEGEFSMHELYDDF